MSFQKLIQKFCKLNLKEHIFYFTCDVSNFTDAISQIILTGVAGISNVYHYFNHILPSSSSLRFNETELLLRLPRKK